MTKINYLEMKLKLVKKQLNIYTPSTYRATLALSVSCASDHFTMLHDESNNYSASSSNFDYHQIQMRQTVKFVTVAAKRQNKTDIL